MKMRNRIFAAAAGMVLLTAGCAPEREAASSAAAPAAAEIRWILAMEGASYSKAWESYEVLDAIADVPTSGPDTWNRPLTMPVIKEIRIEEE